MSVVAGSVEETSVEETGLFSFRSDIDPLVTEATKTGIYVPPPLSWSVLRYEIFGKAILLSALLTDQEISVFGTKSKMKILQEITDLITGLLESPSSANFDEAQRYLWELQELIDGSGAGLIFDEIWVEIWLLDHHIVMAINHEKHLGGHLATISRVEHFGESFAHFLANHSHHQHLGFLRPMVQQALTDMERWIAIFEQTVVGVVAVPTLEESNESPYRFDESRISRLGKSLASFAMVFLREVPRGVVAGLYSVAGLTFTALYLLLGLSTTSIFRPPSSMETPLPPQPDTSRNDYPMVETEETSVALPKRENRQALLPPEQHIQNSQPRKVSKPEGSANRAVGKSRKEPVVVEPYEGPRRRDLGARETRLADEPKGRVEVEITNLFDHSERRSQYVPRRRDPGNIGLRSDFQSRNTRPRAVDLATVSKKGFEPADREVSNPLVSETKSSRYPNAIGLT